MDTDPPSADGEDGGPADAARRRRRPSDASRRLDFDGAGAGGGVGSPEVDEMSEDDVEPVSPLQLFEKFITPEMQARICAATNSRADRYKTILVLASSGYTDLPSVQAALKKPPWVKDNQTWPPKFMQKWKELEVPELKVWLGITLYMGIVQLPQLSDYWCNSPLWGACGGKFGIGAGMSKERYNAIKGILALETVEEERTAEANGLERKIGRWMQCFSKQLKDSRPASEMDQNLSIDEQTVSCKSRWTSQTFQNKHKPAGQGFRIYSINEVEDGYTHAFILDKPALPGSGKIRRITLDLVRSLPRTREYHIYMDNLFTSVSTFRQIRQLGHGACGTWKPRAGAQIPEELLPAGFEAARTADQGDGVQMGDVHGPMYADSGLVAWAWMDSAHINFLTTIHQTDEVGTLERRSSSSLVRGEQGHGKADRAAPLCAICYNKKMLGTDKCDQMRGTYSPQRRSNKPWKALFIWTLDVSCVNAWALWKKSTGPKVITTASRLEFQQRLVEELLGVQPGGENANNLWKAAARMSNGSSRSSKTRRRRPATPQPDDGATMENDHDLPADGADSAHDNATEDPARPLSAEQALLKKWGDHFDICEVEARRPCGHCSEPYKPKYSRKMCAHEDCEGVHLHLECWGPWHKEKLGMSRAS